MANAFPEEWLWKNEEIWRTPGVAKFILALANRNGVTYSQLMEKELRAAAGLTPRKLGDPPRLPRPTPPAPPPPPPKLDRKRKAAGEGDE